MLQRIQSVFLLLASGSCFGLFGTDVADTPAPVAASELFADASFDLFDSTVLLGLVAAAGAILLLAIFLFKNRKMQRNIVLLGIGLVGAAVGFGGLEFFTDSARAMATPDLGIALPILATVFAFLANSYINKDEKLVRSADRLR